MDERVIYEGFGRRVLTALVDVIFLLLGAAGLALLGFAAGAPLESFSDHPAWWMATILCVQTLCWAFLGATPGMLLLGSQVLAVDTGRRLSLARSCLRCIGLWAGIACLGLGVLWIIWSPRHQGLHDKLARSVVVREDESLLSLQELVESVE